LTIGIETDARRPEDQPATVSLPNPHLKNTACVCGSEKLPFAEYSVVKERPADSRPAGTRLSTHAPVRRPMDRNPDFRSAVATASRRLACRSSPQPAHRRQGCGGHPSR